MADQAKSSIQSKSLFFRVSSCNSKEKLIKVIFFLIKADISSFLNDFMSFLLRKWKDPRVYSSTGIFVALLDIHQSPNGYGTFSQEGEVLRCPTSQEHPELP